MKESKSAEEYLSRKGDESAKQRSVFRYTSVNLKSSKRAEHGDVFDYLEKKKKE